MQTNLSAFHAKLKKVCGANAKVESVQMSCSKQSQLPLLLNQGYADVSLSLFSFNNNHFEVQASPTAVR